MARRRRKRYGRRKQTNFWFIIFQIVVLLALLIAIVEVRDSVADGTSMLMESITGDDVRVQQPEQPHQDLPEESNFPGHRTDDGAERPPASAVDDDDS